VRADDDALPRVLCPVTVRVPFEVRELVNTPSVARRSRVKNDPVEVALVNDADTAERRDEKKLDDVALVFVRLAIVPLVLVSVFAVSADDDALPSTV
jgi:hypothetical protein